MTNPDVAIDPRLPRPEFYAALRDAVAAVIGAERDHIANLANCAALLYQQLNDINWAGFYLLRGDELVLGPFQGKPACIRIALGRGVCGAAARERRSVIVPDVTRFPGHIACDAASRSEIVVPLLEGERLRGVLDVDAPRLARFDEDDRVGLEGIAALIVARSSWSD
ncbi:MAG: GAF domain-containing protein [Vicinamibacteria bacterium]|jgi:GAF domain-containing protein|nr:GAF domain-containing protein [Vicinamibacteria bacterium]